MGKPVVDFGFAAFHPTPFSLLLTQVTRGHPPGLLADQLACGLIQTPAPPLPSFVTLGQLLNHSAGEGVSNTDFKGCYRGCLS